MLGEAQVAKKTYRRAIELKLVGEGSQGSLSGRNGI